MVYRGIFVPVWRIDSLAEMCLNRVWAQGTQSSEGPWAGSGRDVGLVSKFGAFLAQIPSLVAQHNRSLVDVSFLGYSCNLLDTEPTGFDTSENYSVLPKQATDSLWHMLDILVTAYDKFIRSRHPNNMLCDDMFSCLYYVHMFVRFLFFVKEAVWRFGDLWLSLPINVNPALTNPKWVRLMALWNSALHLGNTLKWFFSRF